MPRVIFQVSDREKALMVEAAHRELVTLSEWLRRAAEVRLGGLAAGDGTGSTPDSARRVDEMRPGGIRDVVAPAPAASPRTKCSREARHHINHSGKPCPECGFPKGTL